MSNAIVAVLDLRPLERSFRGLTRAAGDLTAAWKEARRPTLADQRQHARDQAGPDGKWAPRSPFTIERARARGRKRARRTLGRLPGANMVKIGPRSLKVISRAKWSLAQYLGARVGHGARLPARPWLYASRKLLETIAKIIGKRLELNWPRG